MRHRTINFFYVGLVICLIGCNQSENSSITLKTKKQNHQTDLIEFSKAHLPVASPPGHIFDQVAFPSPLGDIPAYISKPRSQNKKLPAIIWLVGGFSNSISETAWMPAPIDNDQSARVFWENGIITMYPSLRGGNENPGNLEGLFGEVDDVIAAFNFLTNLEYVNSDRIYLGGHSTGGTLALLVGESFEGFRSIFSFGPVSRVSNYGQDNLPYDIRSDIEDELRSPVLWLHLIKDPTHIFEGVQGNLLSLNLLKNASENELIHFYAIPKHDHFSILYPVSKIIANKILEDTGDTTNISFSNGELGL